MFKGFLTESGRVVQDTKVLHNVRRATHGGEVVIGEVHQRTEHVNVRHRNGVGLKITSWKVTLFCGEDFTSTAARKYAIEQAVAHWGEDCAKHTGVGH